MYNDDSKLIVYHYKFSNNSDIKIGYMLKPNPSYIMGRIIKELSLSKCVSHLPDLHLIIKNYERSEKCHIISWQKSSYENFRCDNISLVYDITVECAASY